MAKVLLCLADRDTKRWHVCLFCLIRELESIPEAKVVLDKFQAHIGNRDDGHQGLFLEFPVEYKVSHEFI